MGNLVIVQPYLPSYRKPFFEAVVGRLAEEGHTCFLVTGVLDKQRSARGDSLSGPDWHIERKTVSFRLLGRHFRSYGSRRYWKDADAVVLEAAVGSLDTAIATFFNSKRHGVGVWGHLGSYTGTENKIVNWLALRQLRKSDLVFAYTDQGRTSAIKRGVSAEKILALENTVDVQNLLAEMDAVSSVRFVGTEKFDPRMTLSYIGGIDTSKRIEFLIQTLDILWQRNPSIKLLVGGSGPLTSLFEPAVRRGQVVMLGRVGDVEKAQMSRQSVGLLLPGRVGLVVVESFVLGLPIITTDWPLHAPEFAYLSPGVDCVVSQNSVEGYSAAIESYLSDEERMISISAAARRKSGWPSMEHMVDTFVSGCKLLLKSKSF